MLLMCLIMQGTLVGCRARNVRAVKVTTNDVFFIALPLERYAHEHGGFPNLARGDASRLRAYLEPKYIRKMPTRDGWGNPIQVEVQLSGYSIWSRGRDGKDDGKWTLEPTDSFDCDIVYQNRRYVQYPEGISAVHSYEMSESEIR